MVDQRKTPQLGKKNPIGKRVGAYFKLSPTVIDDIHIAAREEGKAAWVIVEEAVREWLARRKPNRRT
jgi:hypothetical protein